MSLKRTVRILLDINRGTEVTVELRSLICALNDGIASRGDQEGKTVYVPDVWANGDGAMVSVKRVSREEPLVEVLSYGFFCRNVKCGIWNNDREGGSRTSRTSCRACFTERPTTKEGYFASVPQPPDAHE